MKTFSFSPLAPLQDFQFLTDSSGYVLTQTGQLYRFVGQQTARVETPREFTISHFYFRDFAHGALVGVAAAPAPPLRQGDIGGAAVPWLLLLGWVAWQRRRQPVTRRLATGLSGLLLASGLLLSCSAAWQQYRAPDPTSPATTVLTHAPLARTAFHHYLPNKGQQSFIAHTLDQGRNWQTHQIPSNFFPSALTALGRNYVVGTYARPEAGPIPLHGDGDLWLYGTDATRTPQLATNSPQRPYSIALSRGVTGFHVSAVDSSLYVFGSDRIPTFPRTVMSATAGNIYVLPPRLGSPTKLLDTPDTVDVHSLSQSGTGELWVTMAGRKPQLSHGNLGYVALPTKRLLRFTRGRWQPVSVPGVTSFEQVEFVPGTSTGYLLAESGQLLVTRTNGDTWQPLTGPRVRQLHVWQHAITWLQADNQLVLQQVSRTE